MAFSFDRCIAKAITANNIAKAVVYRLAYIAEGGEPSASTLQTLEPTRINIAEFVIKQLDAYDQRT